MMKIFSSLFCLFLLVAPANSQTGFVVDHRHTNISQIPNNWIDAAKKNLKIRYFRRSHGSQLDTGGMNALRSYSSEFKAKYAYSKTGGNGTLMLSVPSPWVSLDFENSTWVQITRNYLNNPANAQINVVMWAWSSRFYLCDANKYVADMETLIGEYGPNGSLIRSGTRTVPVTFVFQTACGNYSVDKNQQIFNGNNIIRKHCIQNSRVLFDFNDLECWDPDGKYYGDAKPDGTYTNARMLNDDLAYKSAIPGGSVWNGKRNWGIDWMAKNPTSELSKLAANNNCISCSHSQGIFEGETKDNSRLHCVLKGRAAWWLWARLAGWQPGLKKLEAVADPPLVETNLNGSSIELALIGDTFRDNNLLASNFILSGAPFTTTIKSVEYIDNSHAKLVLSYSGTNLNDDINNFNITISKAELSGVSDLTSNNILIYAYNGSLEILCNTEMAESNLNSKQINLVLTNETFKDNFLDLSNLQLNNAPVGLSVSSISIYDNRHAVINLAFNRTDFTTDISNFNITILGTELSGNHNLTSNDLSIATTNTILHISSNPALAEGNLNNKKFNAHLTNEVFIDNSINPSNIQLNNPPAGLSVRSVTCVDSRNAAITLNFDGTNFSTDITNFSIAISKAELSGDYDMSSNNLIIAAYNGSVQISVNPDMTESNLNNKEINLEFMQETIYDRPISVSNIQLNNAPNGLSVLSATSSDNRHATVVLSYDGSNLDSDINNFNITISEIELKGVVDLTSNSLIIKAIDENALTKSCEIKPVRNNADSKIETINQEKLDVSVYPNPSTGQFKLGIKNALSGNVFIKVLGSNGQIIETLSLYQGQTFHEFEYQHLTKGQYHLIIENEGKRCIKTIVLK